LIFSQSVVHKTTDYWYKEHDRSINFNDPELNIDWMLEGIPILSDKDRDAVFLKDAELF
jgi:dTDP-4-dehydrorhamnose 3,5-epimerase